MANPNKGYNPFIIHQNVEEEMNKGGKRISFFTTEEPAVLVGTLGHFEKSPTTSNLIRGKFLALEPREGLEWEETNNHPFVNISFWMDFDPQSEKPQGRQGLEQTNAYLNLIAEKTNNLAQVKTLFEKANALEFNSEAMRDLYVGFINDVFGKVPYAALVGCRKTYSPKDNGGYYVNYQPQVLTTNYFAGTSVNMIARPNTATGIAELKAELERVQSEGNDLIKDEDPPADMNVDETTNFPSTDGETW